MRRKRGVPEGRGKKFTEGGRNYFQGKQGDRSARKKVVERGSINYPAGGSWHGRLCAGKGGNPELLTKEGGNRQPKEGGRRIEGAWKREVRGMEKAETWGGSFMGKSSCRQKHLCEKKNLMIKAQIHAMSWKELQDAIVLGRESLNKKGVKKKGMGGEYPPRKRSQDGTSWPGRQLKKQRSRKPRREGGRGSEKTFHAGGNWNGEGGGKKTRSSQDKKRNSTPTSEKTLLPKNYYAKQENARHTGTGTTQRAIEIARRGDKVHPLGRVGRTRRRSTWLDKAQKVAEKGSRV